MKSYRVTWEIDVEAESPREAAIAAMRMQDEHTTANDFTVRFAYENGRTSAVSWQIDLGDEPRHFIISEIEEQEEESEDK